MEWTSWQVRHCGSGVLDIWSKGIKSKTNWVGYWGCTTMPDSVVNEKALTCLPWLFDCWQGIQMHSCVKGLNGT